MFPAFLQCTVKCTHILAGQREANSNTTDACAHTCSSSDGRLSQVDCVFPCQNQCCVFFYLCFFLCCLCFFSRLSFVVFWVCHSILFFFFFFFLLRAFGVIHFFLSVLFGCVRVAREKKNIVCDRGQRKLYDVCANCVPKHNIVVVTHTHILGWRHNVRPDDSPQQSS